MFHYGSPERFGGLNVPFIVGGPAAGGGSAHPFVLQARSIHDSCRIEQHGLRLGCHHSDPGHRELVEGNSQDHSNNQKRQIRVP